MTEEERPEWWCCCCCAGECNPPCEERDDEDYAVSNPTPPEIGTMSLEDIKKVLEGGE